MLNAQPPAPARDVSCSTGAGLLGPEINNSASSADRDQQTSLLVRLPRAKDSRSATYMLSRWIFLRLLGCVFLIAFVSLWVQIHGLVGVGGILPVSQMLDRAYVQLDSPYWQLPTLCWFNASDAVLHGLCAAGVLLSGLLIIGIGSGPVLLVLWLVYLSLAVAGQMFLSFQWDVLLLETGFCSVFLAPWAWLETPCRNRPPSWGGLWLLRSLLFKLMFLSGVTKLLSGDLTWWNLTALDVHYQTQPLPTWVGWYAHQLPQWFQRLSVAVMFGIEILVPFLIFAPRRLRHLGCFALVGLQILIAVTGNYGFFNLLTLILCVLLLDDGFWARLRPKKQGSDVNGPDDKVCGRGWTGWVATPMVVVLLAVSFLVTVNEMVRTEQNRQRNQEYGQKRRDLPRFVSSILNGAEAYLMRWARPWVLSPIRPFRTISGYGLFRDMTETRPEIVIEASDDGRQWRSYQFKWKPGDANQRPGFVAPHQPRLDWQMWFAALSLERGRLPRWLQRLGTCLLEGRSDVLALFADNPFPDRPPTSIRVVLFQYRFTDLEAKGQTGAWWHRDQVGVWVSGR